MHTVDVRALDDEQLLELADEAAFATLYRRHAAAAHALARGICGPELADDATQAAFMSLWRGAPRFDPARGSVRNLLLTMVRYRSVDALRKHRSALTPRPPEDVADGDPLVQPLSEALAADERRRLATALAALPRSQYDVIHRAYFLGMSHTEIATDLDAPLGTVKGRMRLGLEKIAGYL